MHSVCTIHIISSHSYQKLASYSNVPIPSSPQCRSFFVKAYPFENSPHDLPPSFLTSSFLITPFLIHAPPPPPSYSTYLSNLRWWVCADENWNHFFSWIQYTFYLDKKSKMFFFKVYNRINSFKINLLDIGVRRKLQKN